MSSKRAQRRRGCEGKVRHPDAEAAHAHAAHLRRRLGSPAHAYACPYCGAWHVGRPDRRTRQSMRAQRQNRAKDEE